MLQAGDLIATRSTGAVGWLIRFGESVQERGWLKTIWAALKRLVGLGEVEDPNDPWYYNHIAVYIGRGQLIEALSGGLTVSPLTKYTQFRELPLAKALYDPQGDERSNAMRFARDAYGRHTDYGWLEIGSIIGQLTTPSKLDVSWNGALICSAFGAQVWEHAGVNLPFRSSLGVKPSDLVQLVEAK